ncbi:MAG: SAM-dependent methyltransferase [Candidatus Woesearchaeota archaeon]
MKYIIEHLDKRLYKWCFLEYKHAAEIVGKANIIFTNVSGKKSVEKLSVFGKVYTESLVDTNILDNNKICILDLNADKMLTTKDKDKFDYFVFGGIMGDYPPQNRTKTIAESLKEKEKKDGTKIHFEKRHMGKEQMSTDTAVLAAKMIIEDGKNFSEIKFKDTIIIPINDCEEVELPFRYVVDDENHENSEKVILPKGLLEFLKKRKVF